MNPMSYISLKWKLDLLLHLTFGNVLHGVKDRLENLCYESQGEPNQLKNCSRSYL